MTTSVAHPGNKPVKVSPPAHATRQKAAPIHVAAAQPGYKAPHPASPAETRNR